MWGRYEHLSDVGGRNSAGVVAELKRRGKKRTKAKTGSVTGAVIWEETMNVIQWIELEVFDHAS
jgi:hypothetical protein